MHSHKVLIKGVSNNPREVEKAKTEARKTVARTYRVWPICEDCGTELEITSEGYTTADIGISCPKR